METYLPLENPTLEEDYLTFKINQAWVVVIIVMIVIDLVNQNWWKQYYQCQYQQYQVITNYYLQYYLQKKVIIIINFIMVLTNFPFILINYLINLLAIIEEIIIAFKDQILHSKGRGLAQTSISKMDQIISFIASFKDFTLHFTSFVKPLDCLTQLKVSQDPYYPYLVILLTLPNLQIRQIIKDQIQLQNLDYQVLIKNLNFIILGIIINYQILIRVKLLKLQCASYHLLQLYNVLKYQDPLKFFLYKLILFQMLMLLFLLFSLIILCIIILSLLELLSLKQLYHQNV